MRRAGDPCCVVRIDGIIGKSWFLTRLPAHRAILALAEIANA